VIEHPNKPKFVGANHRKSMMTLVAGACSVLKMPAICFEIPLLDAVAA